MTDRASELRDQFDAGFAEPVAEARTGEVELLLVRAGGAAYVIDRRDVTGIHADVPVVAVPSPATELLGLAAIRNVVVPVYALDRVIGAGAPVTAPRWLVTAGAIALAFERFDGYRRLVAPPGADMRGHLRGTLDIDGERRGVLDLASVVATLSRRSAAKDR